MCVENKFYSSNIIKNKTIFNYSIKDYYIQYSVMNGLERGKSHASQK